MKTKHRQYLQNNESNSNNIPPRKYSRQIDRSYFEEKQNQSILNSEKHRSNKSHCYDQPNSNGQLDYLRMIREKEETIRQLTQMLEQINLSSQDVGKVKQLTTTIKDYELQIQGYENQLKEWQNEAKVLRIQNQCLIRVIEKNQVNLPSQRQNILQRQIAQLRESLKLAQKQLEETRHNSENVSEKVPQSEDSSNELRERNRELTQHNHELENECNKLISLLRDRQGQESKKQTCCSGERVTLNKIKQQYNENIKLTRQYFQQQSSHMIEQQEKSLKPALKKIDVLLRKISQLESKRPKASRQKPVQQTASLQIQYLLQKYYQTEKVLEQQKQVNSRLQNQLEIAQKTLRQISVRSMEGSQLLEISCSLRKPGDWSGSVRIVDEMARLKDIQQQNLKLKKNISELKVQIEAEKCTNELKFQTIVSCYENQLNDKASKFKDLNKQITDLKQQIIILKQEIKLKEQLYSSLQLRNSGLMKEIQCRITESNARNNQIKRLQLELQSLTCKSEGQLNHLKQLIKNYQEKMAQLSQNYNVRIEQLENKLGNKQNQINQGQQIIKELKSDLKAERQKIKNIKQKWGYSMQAELEALKVAVLQLHLQDRREDQIHQKSLQIEQDLSLKIDESLRMAQQLSQLRQDISAKQQHNVSLSCHIDTLQRQIEALRHQVRQKSLQNGHLQAQKHLIESNICKANINLPRGQSTGFQAFMGIIDRLLKVEAKRKFISI